MIFVHFIHIYMVSMAHVVKSAALMVDKWS